MARGGALGTYGSGGQAATFQLAVRIEGLEKTSSEFKEARRQVNVKLRDIMVRVGEREALPYLVSAMSAQIGGRWPGTLYVKKDRLGVMIASRARGGLNRALGWLDFGGRRPKDTRYRSGPHTMVTALDKRRRSIDDRILKELMQVFDPLEHSP